MVMLKRKAFLDILIISEAIVMVMMCAVCLWLSSTAQSELSFIEISLDGTAHYISDGRKLLRDWVPDDVLQ